MIDRRILPLLTGALLIGWFAPDLAVVKSGGEVEQRSAGKTAAKPAAALAPSGWHDGPTVLQRQPDGHFYANIVIDEGEYRFLVDTGASVVALTGPDAEAMGLPWDEGSLRPIGRGASGPVYGVPVTIPRMELGGYEARNVEAAIIPEGLGISLLGQSFLSRIDNVSMGGGEMRIGA